MKDRKDEYDNFLKERKNTETEYSLYLLIILIPLFIFDVLRNAFVYFYIDLVLMARNDQL